MRVLLTTGLVLVWAMPAVVAVQVWYWMTNFQNGVLNHVLTTLQRRRLLPARLVRDDVLEARDGDAADRLGRAAVRRPHALRGLAQVPRELVEAASIDGAGSWRAFRDVTFPVLKPILLILTSLSIIWDFGVFTQAYLLIGASQANVDNYLMGVYVYIEGYGHSDFGRGAAISILMLLIVAAAQRLLRPQDGAHGGDGVSTALRRAPSRPAGAAAPPRRRAWDLLGLALFVVLVFPVFWMVSTAFKPDDEINSAEPTWFSLSPTLQHFRDAMAGRTSGRSSRTA